jgi:hypothetical protein
LEFIISVNKINLIDNILCIGQIIKIYRYLYSAFLIPI